MNHVARRSNQTKAGPTQLLVDELRTLGPRKQPKRTPRERSFARLYGLNVSAGPWITMGSPMISNSACID